MDNAVALVGKTENAKGAGNQVAMVNAARRRRCHIWCPTDFSRQHRAANVIQLKFIAIREFSMRL
jgi:hypothetical protein